jgi:Nucleotidyltransferase domain
LSVGVVRLGEEIGVTDQEFAAMVAERSAQIPGVVAVTLGGSRAQGGHGPDSDWDFGLYYRGRLDPADVAALGWPGRVFAPGERGGGVIIGGAWLQVDGRQVDLHYRDLDDVEHWLAEAHHGRFKVERLPFYLAGIPTYRGRPCPPGRQRGLGVERETHRPAGRP